MDNLETFLRNEHCGKDRTIRSAELEERYGCTGADIRHRVNELRSMGVPICSWRRGYYYAASRQDVIDTIYQLESRIRKIKVAEEGLFAFLSKN